MEYNFSDIEQKWQKNWDSQEIYKVSEDTSKPKFYVLDMFPYPSGAGLHVGHPLGYFASDIYARYKRMKGFNVLHPMGFDSFGLPAEQYAVQTGQHPAITTKANIQRYKEQFDKLGFSFDKSREVKTSDPSFYKWTQWIFGLLFNSWYNKKLDRSESIDTLIEHFIQYGSSDIEAAADWHLPFTSEQWVDYSEKEQQLILMNYRLSYLAYADVNWCPALGTVLANDEVKEGVSERGGHSVIKKSMRQWFLRITAFADRLLFGLDELDWTDSMKEMQRNWIGRSEGASIKFNVQNSNEHIEVFTTRPDTIFGATFMVIAPEHALVSEISTEDQKGAIADYLKYVQSRSERERMTEVKKVTGVFTGASAMNPLTEKPIPIWISEYVLAGYGTGAIMAVPSDDDRDHAFATKFELPIIDVIDKSDFPNAAREDKVGRMINSGILNGMTVKDAIYTTISKIEELEIGSRKINYKMRDAGFSRQRYWGEPFPIVFKEDMPYLLDDDKLPVELPEVESYKPTSDGKPPLANNTSWVDELDGWARETNTMPGYAGSSWYLLRYMDPDNTNQFVSKEKEQYWQNVDLYAGGAEHAVGHLLYSRMWHKFLFDRGLVSTEEPFKKLVNQGMIQGKSSLAHRVKGEDKFVSAGLKEQYETIPVHVDIHFVENNVLDIEKVKDWNPDFAKSEFELEDGRFYCDMEVEKMSKSKFNTVNPDDVVAEYGADCFRMYEMFLGPIEIHKPWDTKGIEGVSKFLKKTWRLFYNENGDRLVNEEPPSADELKVLHKLIKKVGKDIERYSFNTAVSAFMVAVNDLGKLNCHKQEILSDLIRVLAPFAPHVSDELWHALGNETSVHLSEFPGYDEQHLKESSITYPIAFNGKTRLTVDVDANWTREEVEKHVRNLEDVLDRLEGKEPKKVIVVPGKMVNFVV